MFVFVLFLWFFFCHFSIYTRIPRRWKVEPCRLPYLSSNWPRACSRSLKCLFLSSSLLTVVVALFTPKFQARRQWKGHVGYHACLQIEAIIFDWNVALAVLWICFCHVLADLHVHLPLLNLQSQMGNILLFLLEYFPFFNWKIFLVLIEIFFPHFHGLNWWIKITFFESTNSHF